MGFAITFMAGLVGLVALTAFKMWELKRKIVLGARVRSFIDKRLEGTLQRVHDLLLVLSKHVSFSAVAHFFAHEAILLFGKVAKFIDVKAESLAMRISRSAHEHKESKKREASDFLREVSEHKQGLDRSQIKRETRL